MLGGVLEKGTALSFKCSNEQKYTCSFTLHAAKHSQRCPESWWDEAMDRSPSWTHPPGFRMRLSFWTVCGPVLVPEQTQLVPEEEMIRWRLRLCRLPAHVSQDINTE